MGRFVYGSTIPLLAAIDDMLGPRYTLDSVYDLSTMQPYSLKDLYVPFSEFTRDVALYLPRTSDLRQLARLLPDDEKMTVIHYCMEGASKVMRVLGHMEVPLMVW